MFMCKVCMKIDKGDQSIWSGFSIGYKMVRFEWIVLETAGLW